MNIFDLLPRLNSACSAYLIRLSHVLLPALLSSTSSGISCSIHIL